VAAATSRATVKRRRAERIFINDGDLRKFAILLRPV
jgi:hypothetical protein